MPRADPAQDAIIAGQGNALTYAGTQTELYQVALHEVGHALGLGESSDPNSVMFPELGPNNTTLDATDLKNIAVLYGGGTGALVGSSAASSSFLAIDPGLLGASASMIAGSAVH